MNNPRDILRFVLSREEPCALIVVTDVTGGTLRAKGAMMAVSASEEVSGYVSNGCVDADIIARAKAAITEGKPRSIRYGRGSAIKDIALPCGGAITLCVQPHPDTLTLKNALEDLENRRQTTLNFGAFSHVYSPPLLLKIWGRGAAPIALLRQALASGFDLQLSSPDEADLEQASGAKTQLLKTPSAIYFEKDDPWTAHVLMFHDHDWETQILQNALRGDAFYIGAMGSARTHKERLETLAALGLSREALSRIHGPIGLIAALRDANFLALSTLAQIVDCAQKTERLT